MILFGAETGGPADADFDHVVGLTLMMILMLIFYVAVDIEIDV